jgi:hypothetical protein
MCLILSLIFFTNLRNTHAAEPEANDRITPLSVLKFTGGMIFAFMVHEGGHLVAAGATQTSTTWRVGSILQPIQFTERSANNTAGLAMNMSGLIAQAGFAEVILLTDLIDKNSSYARGMMFWNLINPIAYAVDYWLIHQTNTRENGCYTGDISGIERYSNKGTADIFAATIVAVSAFQAFRFAKTQTWAPEWMKDSNTLDRVGLMPLPAGGAMLSYQFEF